MKTRYVYIESIDQIDTSRISVYDMNKRFIDANGNMFGLRYNRDRKKVELIRLLRTSSDRAHIIQNRIAENRQRRMSEPKETDITPVSEDESASEAETAAPSGEGELSDEENLRTYDQEAATFEPDLFLSTIFKTIKTHKDRFTGVMNNIQQSKLITHENREQIIQFEDLQRSMEIDVFQKADNITTLYKEITEYPRPLSHYTAHLSSRQRDMFNNLPTDQAKSHYILLAEMEDNIRSIYKNMQDFCDRIDEFITTLEEFITQKTPAQARQALNDATYTLNTTRKEIHGVLSQLTSLEQYLTDLNNFY